MTDCSWRPKRREPSWRHPDTLGHWTYGQPRLPFIRPHQGRFVHRIRYWWIHWERRDGLTVLRHASPYTWCGSGFGTRGKTIGSDVRLMADSADELCRRCFACEIVERVFATGGLVSEAAVEP